MSYDTAIILGAGAFGTSIATVLANNFRTVILKVRSKDVYDSILNDHQNAVYLPGKQLASNIIPALSWEELNEKVDGEVELFVSGLPTTAITGYLYDNFDFILEFLKDGVPFVSLSKGIDPVTLELPDDLYFNYYFDFIDQFTFLSGPSFAREIVDEQITSVSLAGRSKKVLEKVSQMMSTSYFKIFPGYDVKGTLLGGALKNILAVAGGIIEELGLNHNTRAAMITRGIAEMLRFGKVYNARPETFYGLSGMGDLILTTTGDLSRNKAFGIEIAKGRSAKEIINSQRTVVEGYKTSQAVYLLSQKYEIRAKILNGVYSVIHLNSSPREVIEDIISTPIKFELE